MGEIGIPVREFMYELSVWQIRLIIDGYHDRQRYMWNATRWQTWMLMQVGMADLSKSGVHSPKDILHFPWDDEEEISDEDIEDVKELLKEQE